MECASGWKVNEKCCYKYLLISESRAPANPVVTKEFVLNVPFFCGRSGWWRKILLANNKVKIEKLKNDQNDSDNKQTATGTKQYNTKHKKMQIISMVLQKAKWQEIVLICTRISML